MARRAAQGDARGGAEGPRLNQFDPSAAGPARPAPGARAASADTLVPHDDWFAAKADLRARLALPGRGAIVEASSAASRRSTVLGVGVGFRFSQGTLTGEVAVKVFVSEKLPESDLDAASLVPRRVAGLATDVEEVGPPRRHAADAHYPRPVPCGVSVGLAGVFEIGTIGCLVARRNPQTGEQDLCLLSNNHVLANSNGTTDPGASQVGQPVLQPGQVTPGPEPDDVIGQLSAFVPLDPGGANYVDAAVALTSFANVSPSAVTYTLAPEWVAPALGLSVMKDGMMTGSSVGVITDIAVDGLPVPYNGLGTCLFYDQIAVRGLGGAPFSRAGDSGSLIVTLATKQPVALLFSGSDDAITYANPIGRVLDALGIERFVAATEG